MTIEHGSIEKRTYWFEDAAAHMEYAIYVPTGYRPGNKHPLVVLLHALFSNPHQVIRFPRVVSEAERRGYIVVAPFGFNDRGWYGAQGTRNRMSPDTPPARPENLGELSERDVLNVVALVRQGFNIDGQRIYLMGYSMGGSGTLHIGATYPELWAAIAPMSPGILRSSPTRFVDDARRIPVLMVTGDNDWITRVEAARRWVTEMQKKGMDLRYIELAGGSHSWIVFRPEVVTQIFDFFEGHSRPAPAPADVSYVRAVSSDEPVAAESSVMWRSTCRCRDIVAAGRMVYRYGVRGIVPAWFILFNAVSFLQFELLAWSLFYVVKSYYNALVRRLRGLISDGISLITDDHRHAD